MKSLFSWPHLPVHMLMGVLVVSSLTAVQSHPKWAGICLLLWAGYLAGLRAAVKLPGSNTGILARSLVSILFILSLYMVLAGLVFDVIPWDGDPVLSALDRLIFMGGSPVVFLSQFATPKVVEAFSIAYGGFIPYLYFSIFLCLLGREADERAVFVTALTLTYALSFLGYLLVPAKGPVVFMANAFDAALRGGFFHGLVLKTIENAGGPHGAFPSLHIGATWFICFYEIRRGQLRGLLYIPLALGIFFATMLLRYHYFIDLAAGFAIASFSVVAAEKIHGMHRPRSTVFARVCRFFIHHFFGGVQVRGLAHLPEPGRPVLLVSNHANAFVDPFAISAAIGRSLKLTAKAALWKNPLIRSVSGVLGIIPLSRARDSQDKEHRRQNREAFRHCFRALDRSEILCFFPEGKSHSNPSMMPFKTGAARLALEYAAARPDGGGLVILPAGLFYGGKAEFGSRIMVEIGAPIDPAQWIIPGASPDHRALTQTLEKEISALTVQAENKGDAELLVWLSEIYQRMNRMPLPVDQGDRLPAHFIRTARYLIENYYRLPDTREIRGIKQDAISLKTEQEALGISAENLFLPVRFWRAVFFVFREAEILALGALICGAAALVNGLPFLALAALVRGMSKDEDHWATNYLFYGTALFVLWYGCAGAACFAFFGPQAVVLAPALIPGGIFSTYFALRYWMRLKLTVKRLRTFMLFLIFPRLQGHLIQKRRELVAKLLEIKETYNM
ncbi:MAG: phosphatase PAP2 family protein [Desulfobacter sp.]|nr:MAG: phosphatase PAP2 family protein [Desulfobacter sp.]